jgi:hypothetical protein
VTYIEGWDPGGATGYVFGSFTDTRPFTVHGAATLSPPRVRVRMRSWRGDDGVVRVVEDFRLRASNRFTADLQGDRLIGAMVFAEDLGMTSPIIWQMPTDKAHVPDSVLRDGGLWRTPSEGGSRHIHDAIIHVLAYLKTNLKHEPTIRKYWP